MGEHSDRFEVLLVEDNAGDAELALIAMEKSRIPNRISLVRDGEEAMDFLRRSGKHQQAPRPDLIVMDLNLPRRDGREVLAEIKSDRALKLIPVIILSTSKADEDIFHSYNLHANCYICKAMDFEQFMGIFRTIEEFWFATVKLPTRSGRG